MIFSILPSVFLFTKQMLHGFDSFQHVVCGIQKKNALAPSRLHDDARTDAAINPSP